VDGDVVETMPDGSRIVRITRLRAAVLASGFPAYYVGAQAGVHHSTLSKYVRGERDIKVSHLATLSRVLGIPADDLVGWLYYTVSPNGDIESYDDPDL
jgi:transcriptional regulator with XRE-family HTH domain